MPMVRTRRVLDIEGVETVMRAAEQVAREKGFRVVIAVVETHDRAATAALARAPVSIWRPLRTALATPAISGQEGARPGGAPAPRRPA